MSQETVEVIQKEEVGGLYWGSAGGGGKNGEAKCSGEKSSASGFF